VSSPPSVSLVSTIPFVSSDSSGQGASIPSEPRVIELPMEEVEQVKAFLQAQPDQPDQPSSDMEGVEEDISFESIQIG